MKITLWGTRGSVPVSGAAFMRHGGSTTCLSVDCEDAPFVIVDAGTGLAELGKALASGRQSGRVDGRSLVLQTHLHWDHVQGFPFFGGLFDPKAKFDFWSVDRDGETLREVLDRQMSKPTFPVGLDVLPSDLAFHSIQRAGSRSVGGMQVRWAEMDHPSGCTAYRIDHRGQSFVFSGDVEVQRGSRDALIQLARGADVLVMDAQYFPDEYASRVGWGHSTPADAVEVAVAAGVSRLVMTHHDPSHDDVQLERKQHLGRELARGTGLVVDNAYDRMTIQLGDVDTRAAA